MEQFNETEKREFANSVAKFIRLLHTTVYPGLSVAADFLVREASYGIRLNDDYFYFDYPYSKDIDQLNIDLANPVSKLVDVDEALFKELREKRGESGKPAGYISYRYSIANGEFHTDYQTNIRNGGPDAELHGKILLFLPVMHFSIYQAESYLDPVLYVGDIGAPVFNLLYLNMALPDVIRTGSGSNPHVITAAFVSDKPNTVPIEKVVEELYSVVFPYLEFFYTSPLVVKLMEEKRKSHIMAYRHSYGNISPLILRLVEERLQDADNIIDAGDVFADMVYLKRLLYAQDLTLTAMFHTEAHYKSAKALYDGHALAKKGINEILNYYDIVANYDEINVKIKPLERSYKPENYIPNQNLLMDIHLILWNLWENACGAAKASDKLVEINLDRPRKNEITVSFKNNGILDPRFVSYIKNECSYPSGADSEDTYKGLEIVGDKLKEKGWSWYCSSDEAGNGTVGATLITVKFNLK